MTDKKRYVGNKLILNVVAKEGKSEVVVVTFKKGEQLEMLSEVFDLVSTDSPQEGKLSDVIEVKLALKLLLTISNYGIPVIQVQNVAQRMANIAQNKLDEKTAEMFGAKLYTDILLKQVV